MGPHKKRPWDPVSYDDHPLVELDAEPAQMGGAQRAPSRAFSETYQKLIHYMSDQASIPPAIQDPIILDLMAVRARFCPRFTSLASG